MSGKTYLEFWVGVLNDNIKRLGGKLIVPSCFGHMYGNVRWAIDGTDKKELSENAVKLANCVTCRKEVFDRCYCLSNVSYTYQGIHKGLL